MCHSMVLIFGKYPKNKEKTKNDKVICVVWVKQITNFTDGDVGNTKKGGSWEKIVREVGGSDPLSPYHGLKPNKYFAFLPRNKC